MRNEYDLAPRKARACRWAAAFFALVAALSLATPIVILVLTGEPLSVWRCTTDAACEFGDGSLEPLDDGLRAAIAASPAAAETYAAHLARAPVWVGLSVLTLLRVVPFAALLLGVALALRSLGTARGIGGALRWIRLAAIAAVLAALAPPIVGVLQSVLLLPGTPHGAGYALELDGGPLFLHLLLAIAALALAWGLEAGHRAQRDLAEIV